MGRLLLLFRAIAAVAGWHLARKKGYNGLLWAVLCGLIPLLAVVIVFLPPKTQAGITRECPYCRRPVSPGEDACRHCQRILPVDLVRCGGCGAYVPRRDSCAQCNAPMA